MILGEPHLAILAHAHRGGGEPRRIKAQQRIGTRSALRRGQRTRQRQQRRQYDLPAQGAHAHGSPYLPGTRQQFAVAVRCAVAPALFAAQNHVVLPLDASCDTRLMLVESLSQLPPARVYPAPHAGEVTLPAVEPLMVAGAEACDVHCRAVASDTTK